MQYMYVYIYMCVHIYLHRGFTFFTTTVDSTASVDYSGSDLMRRDPEPGQLWIQRRVSSGSSTTEVLDREEPFILTVICLCFNRANVEVNDVKCFCVLAFY